MAFNGTDIDDLDVTTPDGSSDAPSTLDDAIREIKTVLKNQYAVISKAFGDSPYTATTSDSIILVDASGGAVTINLPAVATVSSSTDTKSYTVIKTDASANAVTIDGDGAETINGSATATVSFQYSSEIVTGDGTEWFTGLGSEIGTANIEDGAVTTAKIANEAVTEVKLPNFSGANTVIAWGADEDGETAVTNSGGEVTLLRARAGRAGEIRMTLEGKIGGGNTITVTFKKNGSTENTQTFTTGSFVTRNHDETIAVDDLLEIKATANGDNANNKVRNPRLRADVFTHGAFTPVNANP